MLDQHDFPFQCIKNDKCVGFDFNVGDPKDTDIKRCWLHLDATKVMIGYGQPADHYKINRLCEKHGMW